MSDTQDHVLLAAELTAAWLGNVNTRVDADAVPRFLEEMHRAIRALSDTGTAPPDAEAEGEQAMFVPAVSVRKSLASREHIVSMIDGKPYRTLRRHLSAHGLTPDSYRQRYGLRPDYPMTAPAYSEARSARAKQHGFGRKPAEGAAEAEPQPARRRTRRPADAES